MALALELNYTTNTIHAGENNANQNQLNCASFLLLLFPLTIFEGKSDKPLPGTINIGPFGAVIKTTSDDEDLLIAGDDKHKREWSVQLGLNAYASRFYEADLTVVLDTREGRKIISLSANTEIVKALLDTIGAGNYERSRYR